MLIERELDRDPKLVAKHLVKNDHGAWILDECLSADELATVKAHAPLLSGHVFKEVDRRRAEAEQKRQAELAELDKQIADLKAEIEGAPEQSDVDVSGDDSIQVADLPADQALDVGEPMEQVTLPASLRQADEDAEPEQAETVEEEEP